MNSRNDKIEIMICDDDELICRELEEKVRQSLPGSHIQCFSSGEQLLRESSEADLIFLDIELPGMDGMTVAEQLGKNQALVIFVSAHDEYVFDAFDVGAFHYLLKPLERERFERVLARACKEIRRRKRREPLQIKEQGEFKTIYPEEIYYAESNGRKLTLYTVQGTYEYYGRMQELEARLGEDFYRCHRGYLVHLKYVAGYDAANIQLKDGSNVYLARQKYGEFVKRYMAYLRQKIGDFS